MTLKTIALALLLAVPSVSRAQEAAAPAQKSAADLIMPHITDSKHLEFPCFNRDWACEYELPTWNVHIGAKDYDFGPTKHVVFLLIAAFLTCALLITIANLHARASKEVGHPKGFAAGLEAVILYLRQEIYLKVLGGHGGEKYVPFALTLFFFILFCNLLGLLPFGSSPTGNIAVTATLAIITLVVVEVAGMKALGAGYISTIIYWPHDVSFGVKSWLTFILSPIELISKLTKPFALTIRLFANMIAGHVILLALMGLMLTFGLYAAPSLLMALFMMFLELMVAGIQAFIFSVLAAVFIGQIREAHH